MKYTQVVQSLLLFLLESEAIISASCVRNEKRTRSLFWMLWDGPRQESCALTQSIPVTQEDELHLIPTALRKAC